MDDYREIVLREAQAERGEVILNRTPDHAAIVVSEIFRKAERIVEITTGCLEGVLWGNSEVISAAIDFLTRTPDSRIRVIAERDVDRDNAFLNALVTNNLRERIQLFRIPVERATVYKFQFIVADGRHHRFQRDREKFEAMIQFGDAEIGQKLRRIFAGLREHAVQVNLA